MTDSPTLTNTFDSLGKGIWWWVLARGIFAVIFGVIAIIAPGTALTAIAIVFGAYALVDGVTTIMQAIRMRNSFTAWGWLLVQGILSALAGLAALILPGIAGAFGGLVVLWTIVIWNVMHGFAGIRSAAGASAGRAKTWGTVGGVLSVAFGIVLAVFVLLTPGATLLGLVWAVGIYAVAFGVTLVITAIQVRIAAHSNSATVKTA